MCKRCDNIIETNAVNLFGKTKECCIHYRKEKGNTNSISQEEFEKRVELKHPDCFDMSETIYVNTSTSVDILCKRCDTTFEIMPGNLYGKTKECCEVCRKEKGYYNSLTQEEFEERVESKYPNCFDMTDSVYNGGKNTLDILCKRCNTKFEIIAGYLLSKVLECCKTCADEKYKVNFQDYLNLTESLGFTYCSDTIPPLAGDKSNWLCKNKHKIFKSYSDMKDYAGCGECSGLRPRVLENYQTVCDETKGKYILNEIPKNV